LSASRYTSTANDYLKHIDRRRQGRPGRRARSWQKESRARQREKNSARGTPKACKTGGKKEKQGQNPTKKTRESLVRERWDPKPQKRGVKNTTSFVKCGSFPNQGKKRKEILRTYLRLQEKEWCVTGGLLSFRGKQSLSTRSGQSNNDYY